MIKKLKLMLVAGLLSLNFALLFTPIAAASPATDACETLRLANPTAPCDNPDTAKNKFGDIIKTVINILSVIVGAASVIMIIIGGFRYVVSGGDSNGISGAKNTIMYAIIGLVIVLFAQIIVRFVIDRGTANPNTPPTNSSNVIPVQQTPQTKP